MNCPQHGPECIWYRHNSDRVGLDLGVGDGQSNAVDFVAAGHGPMPRHQLPVSSERGDYFALGFFTGLTRAWCTRHETSDCLGTWACAKEHYFL